MFPDSTIQRFKETPTPFYHYDIGLLRQTLDTLSEHANRYGFNVHYALKANVDGQILKEINSAGLGADCVSGNEVKRAIETGFAKEKIVFAGVGKTDKEINYALDNDIFCFNCESEEEIIVINELACAKNKIAGIALRINPNVDANTHHYITTGLEENKFGINISELDSILTLVQSLKSINLIGVHFHIGSQITDFIPFENLCSRANEILQLFNKKGINIRHINVGGGLGINYIDPDKDSMPDFEKFFKIFNDNLKRKPNQQVHFELGRSIVGQCGTLISKVLYVKKGINSDFVILDAGMTELIRPALYQSYHKIENLSKNVSDSNKTYTIVGPVCESSDTFAKNIEFPTTQRNDIIAIRSAGAYGEVMASNYNLREKPEKVYSY